MHVHLSVLQKVTQARESFYRTPDASLPVPPPGFRSSLQQLLQALPYLLQEGKRGKEGVGENSPVSLALLSPVKQTGMVRGTKGHLEGT